MNCQIRTNQLDQDTSYHQLSLVTSNRTYSSIVVISSMSSDAGYWTMNIHVLADMDASDTAVVRFHVPNSGAAIADIEHDSYFSGFYVC